MEALQPAPAKSFVLFRVDGKRFAIELATTERILHAVEVTPLAGAPDVVLGIINVRGTIVPVYNLRRRLGLAEREIDVTDQILLARSTRRTVALVVDAVIGVVERWVSDEADGTAVADTLQLEDGPVPIQHVETFLSPAEEEVLTAQLEASYGARSVEA